MLFQMWKLNKGQVFLDSCLGSGLRPLFYHFRRTLSLIVKSEFISGRIYLRKLDDCCCKSVYITLRHFLKSLGEIFGRQIDQESFWSGKVATIGFGEGIQSGHQKRSPDGKMPHGCKNTLYQSRFFLPTNTDLLLRNCTADIEYLKECNFIAFSILWKEESRSSIKYIGK